MGLSLMGLFVRHGYSMYDVNNVDTKRGKHGLNHEDEL